MFKKDNRRLARKRRHIRVRKKISGTTDCPRLNVFRSNKHIYVQLIDDLEGQTLASASTLDPELKADVSSNVNKDVARKVGELIARRALEKGIAKVVFDRGGYLYHGRVKALADGAREGGLKL